MIIIDGTNQILGRVAVYSAKKALLGEQIAIINCEKIILSGTRTFILSKFEERKERGHPYDGPFYPKSSDRIVRRTIRGMLPYKQERGKQAYKKIMCYIGVPKQFQGKTYQIVPGADASKLETNNFMELQEISAFLGKTH